MLVLYILEKFQRLTISRAYLPRHKLIYWFKVKLGIFQHQYQNKISKVNFTDQNPRLQISLISCDNHFISIIHQSAMLSLPNISYLCCFEKLKYFQSLLDNLMDCLLPYSTQQCGVDLLGGRGHLRVRGSSRRHRGKRGRGWLWRGRLCRGAP